VPSAGPPRREPPPRPIRPANPEKPLNNKLGQTEKENHNANNLDVLWHFDTDVFLRQQEAPMSPPAR
jgi:hypothetical protein